MPPANWRDPRTEVLGIVEFANVSPLHFTLSEDESTRFVRGVPTTLNEALRRGEIDLTLVSSVEFVRHRESYRALPDFSIATLEEIFLAVPDALMIMELKPTEVYQSHDCPSQVAALPADQRPDLAAEVARLIAVHDMTDQGMVASFVDDLLHHFMALAPDVDTSYPLGESLAVYTAYLTGAPIPNPWGHEAMQVPRAYGSIEITEDLVATARAVLEGYQSRYAALTDAVTETEPALRDELLATIPIVDLLTEPVHVDGEGERGHARRIDDDHPAGVHPLERGAESIDLQIPLHHFAMRLNE